MAVPRSPNKMVAALLVVAAALLVTLLALLGNVWLRPGYKLFADFDFAGNIQPGAPVRVSGFKVGRIDDIEFLGGEIDPKTGRSVQVRLHVWLENRVSQTIRQDAEFYINTAGVLGEQYLEIVPGTREKPALAANSTVRGTDPPRTDLIFARLYELLDSITRLLRDDRDLIRDFLKSGASLVRTLDGILQANHEQVGSLIANLDKFTLETTALVRSVRQGVGDAARIRAMLANVERLSAAISRDIDPLIAKAKRALDGVGELGQAVGPSQRESIRRALDQLGTISERVSRTTADAQLLVADLRMGKGTAGAFLRDEQLYDDVKEMVRDLKRNPWKFLWRE